MERPVHQPIVDGIVFCLKSIFVDRRPADKVLEFTFKNNRKWGSRDRRQVAETVYELVRWWRRELWRVGVDWTSDDTWPTLQDDVYPKLLNLYGLTEESLKERSGIESESLAVRLSFPDWMNDWASSQVQNWPETATVLNEQAPVFLRTNTLKTTPEKLVARLADTEIVSGNTVVLKRRFNVFVTEEFKAGMFEVQDQHSQSIVPLLDVQPGQRVIDACAGAGGKTLQIAALMKNKGRVLALDIHDKKLAELRQRSRRAGCDVVEARLIESQKSIKRLADSADRLLLDVPCSGLGVLRRNPDSKWRLSMERVEELIKLQADLLGRYSKMLKKGGILVYSTCSIAAAENQDQVRRFLENSPQFELVEERSWAPERRGGDGFYAAKLIHRGS